MQKILQAAKPLDFGEGNRLFSGASVPEIDMNQIVYFAISIFWRGAVHHWKASDGSYAPKIDLGIYQEAFRTWLLGQGALPIDISLITFIWPLESDAASAVIVPQPSSSNDGFWFYAHGLGFLLRLGLGIPASMKQHDSVHAHQRFIWTSPDFAQTITTHLREALLAGDHIGLEKMNMEISELRSRSVGEEN